MNSVEESSLEHSNLKKGLLSLRLSVFLVMFMWTIDKFINPVHASKVFKHFYFIDNLSSKMSYIVGSIQLILVIGFLVGFKKKWTYGSVLLMHTVSTLSSFAMYINPWGPKNLLFFAAWPMLTAIYTLFILRDKDTLLIIPHSK